MTNMMMQSYQIEKYSIIRFLRKKKISKYADPNLYYRITINNST